ncbi:MAG TPA: hypothetical protein VK619_06830 [Pyrinomonadaceae bacterium]|nr:hypothetical protein [Pyrinomonadaceae bacterium]
MSGCNVTPVSTKYPIWYLNIYATATGSDKLAVAGLVGATGTSSLSGKGVSVSGWTDLYDPNIEGNVIESLIYGFVRLDDDTVENFSFEKTVVLQT